MPSICYSSIKGLAMRVTRLDSIGCPVGGENGGAVSKGFVSVGLTANIEDGEEFTVKNAAGEMCISERDNPLLKWLDLAIEFCEVDPEMFELMTGGRLLEDWQGNSVGFTMSETYVAAPFALEVWTKVAGTPTTNQWIYWLFPMVINGILGDLTLENGPVSFTLAGNTKSNGCWGLGPFDVVAQDAALTAGPLQDPVLPGEHLYHRLTEIAPPTTQCGYVTVEAPEVVPATGATAGTPGLWTPSGSVPPGSVADLIAGTPNAVTASPTTTWTVGQSVKTGDNADAYWDGTGTTWVAGVAP